MLAVLFRDVAGSPVARGTHSCPDSKWRKQHPDCSWQPMKRDNVNPGLITSLAAELLILGGYHFFGSRRWLLGVTLLLNQPSFFSAYWPHMRCRAATGFKHCLPAPSMMLTAMAVEDQWFCYWRCWHLFHFVSLSILMAPQHGQFRLWDGFTIFHNQFW